MKIFADHPVTEQRILAYRDGEKVDWPIWEFKTEFKAPRYLIDILKLIGEGGSLRLTNAIEDIYPLSGTIKSANTNTIYVDNKGRSLDPQWFWYWVPDKKTQEFLEYYFREKSDGVRLIYLPNKVSLNAIWEFESKV